MIPSPALIPSPLIPLIAVLSLGAGTIPLIAALAGPVVAYLVAARRFSGKIQTTEATDLWEESRSIREWSRERMNELEAKNTALEKRIKHLEDENADLRGRLRA